MLPKPFGNVRECVANLCKLRQIHCAYLSNVLGSTVTTSSSTIHTQPQTNNLPFIQPQHSTTTFNRNHNFNNAPA
eukprot:2605922-Prymnesium_polylepis.1